MYRAYLSASDSRTAGSVWGFLFLNNLVWLCVEICLPRSQDYHVKELHADAAAASLRLCIVSLFGLGFQMISSESCFDNATARSLANGGKDCRVGLILPIISFASLGAIFLFLMQYYWRLARLHDLEYETGAWTALWGYKYPILLEMVLLLLQPIPAPHLRNLFGYGPR
jgi:hypothetical protein